MRNKQNPILRFFVIFHKVFRGNERICVLWAAESFLLPIEKQCCVARLHRVERKPLGITEARVVYLRLSLTMQGIKRSLRVLKSMRKIVLTIRNGINVVFLEVLAQQRRCFRGMMKRMTIDGTMRRTWHARRTRMGIVSLVRDGSIVHGFAPIKHEILMKIVVTMLRGFQVLVHKFLLMCLLCRLLWRHLYQGTLLLLLWSRLISSENSRRMRNFVQVFVGCRVFKHLNLLAW